MSTEPPLSPAAMELRLEEHVEPVLSIRRSAAGPAAQLTDLKRKQQELVLHWVEAIAQTNSEMAYQFAAYASDALRHMDSRGVEAWVIEAIDVFDEKGTAAVGSEVNVMEPRPANHVSAST